MTDNHAQTLLPVEAVFAPNGGTNRQGSLLTGTSFFIPSAGLRMNGKWNVSSMKNGENTGWGGTGTTTGLNRGRYTWPQDTYCPACWAVILPTMKRVLLMLFPGK